MICGEIAGYFAAQCVTFSPRNLNHATSDTNRTSGRYRTLETKTSQKTALSPSRVPFVGTSLVGWGKQGIE
jgi:hypothetical protein